MNDPENQVLVTVRFFLGKEKARAEFDSTTGKMTIEGALFPADVTMLAEIVGAIRAQKDRYRSRGTTKDVTDWHLQPPKIAANER